MEIDPPSPLPQWQAVHRRQNNQPLRPLSPLLLKRGRSASPDRQAKRPALIIHPHSHSLSNTPLTPSSPLLIGLPDPVDRLLQQHHLLDSGEVKYGRDGSCDSIGYRTGRLGLRTPELGLDPDDSSPHPTKDVEMCDEEVSRPILPLRRPSALVWSHSFPTTRQAIPPSSSNTCQPALAPVPPPFSPLNFHLPLHRPHPQAFQQHLALSSPKPSIQTTQKVACGLRLTMGPREGCQKCKDKVPGHFSHILTD